MMNLFFKKHVLWIFVLSPWINVWAAKSFSRWTKLIDHEEISPKTCSDFCSDSYSPLEFQFYKTPVLITFLIFFEIYVFHQFYYFSMIFVTFSAIIHCFHDYFATWSKYFATWDLFRASGALPARLQIVQPAPHFQLHHSGWTKTALNSIDYHTF